MSSPRPSNIDPYSKKGTPQQATASKTINLVNPIQTPATASFSFSDFPGIDFTDVDYIKLKFDNVKKDAVDYLVSKIYTECATLIELSKFKAIAANRKVILVWETATEIDNAGFNILRAESEDGPYTQINESIIPAKSSSIEGAGYHFFDTTVKNRQTYYYKLEDVDVDEIATLHGPVSATPRFIFGKGLLKRLLTK